MSEVPATESGVEAPVAVMERADRVLGLFIAGEGLTLTQVVRASGIPRSSAHRLLEQLVRLSWVERRGSRYFLGPRMVEMGHEGVRQHPVRQAAHAAVRQLARRTHGWVAISGVREDRGVVVLDQWAEPTLVQAPSATTAARQLAAAMTTVLAEYDGQHTGRAPASPVQQYDPLANVAAIVLREQWSGRAVGALALWVPTTTGAARDPIGELLRGAAAEIELAWALARSRQLEFTA